MLGPIRKIKGKGLPLPGNDIDTDRIIPARFLRCVTFAGLGENAFCDERFSADGTLLNHPMNEDAHRGAKIILTGNNFGCGSSREHAPQAIKRAGYEAIIAESFAEIFYGNSSLLGLVCVCLPKKDIEEITAALKSDPETEIEIDIEARTASAGGKVYKISVKDPLRTALLEGTYDTLPELMKNKDLIAKFNAKLPPVAYAL